MPGSALGRRRVFVGAIAVVAADGLLFSLIAPAVPRLAARHDLSDAEVAVIFAAFPAAMILVALAGAGIVHRLGQRRSMLLGGALLVAATVAFTLVPTAAGLLLARAVQGAGGGLAWTGALTAVAGAFPAAERGVRMAALESSAGGAGLVGPVVGGVALDRVGFAATFFGAAVVVAVTLVPVALMPRTAGERVLIERRGLRLVMAQPAARAAVLATIVVGAILALLEPLLPLDLDERLGLSATQIGLVFAAGSVAYLISAPIVGRVSDRRGRRAPVVVGLVATAAALPFMAIGPVWVPVAAFVVIGVGLGGAIGPTGALVSQGVDDAGLAGAYALGGSLLVLVFAVGSLVGPLFGGVASLGLPFLVVVSVGSVLILAAALACDRLLAPSA